MASFFFFSRRSLSQEMLPLGFRLFAAQNPVATGGNFRGKQVAFWHQGDGAITLLAELV